MSKTTSKSWKRHTSFFLEWNGMNLIESPVPTSLCEAPLFLTKEQRGIKFNRSLPTNKASFEMIQWSTPASSWCPPSLQKEQKEAAQLLPKNTKTPASSEKHQPAVAREGMAQLLSHGLWDLRPEPLRDDDVPPLWPIGRWCWCDRGWTVLMWVCALHEEEKGLREGDLSTVADKHFLEVFQFNMSTTVCWSEIVCWSTLNDCTNYMLIYNKIRVLNMGS